MTLHSKKPAKREVGVRELHDHLSRYLRAVEEGARVVVTSRGRPIAHLVPPSEGDPLAELRARGLVTDPIRPRRRNRGRRGPVPTAPVADLVKDQRR